MKLTLRRRLAVAALAITAVASLAACTSDASKTDIKQPQQKAGSKALPSDFEVRVPEKLTVYQNIDQHPTIAEVCIDGVAFATTSRNYGDAVTRVPEWDKHCPGASSDTSDSSTTSSTP